MSKNKNHETAHQLSILLADTYLLYLKTQKFHWNVTGPHFALYHKFFEDLYEALADAADDIAERIRTLGAFSPGSFQEFLKLATLSESLPLKGEPMTMLNELYKDHALLCDKIKAIINAIKSFDDIGTEDFLIERLRYHEKTLWMLGAHLENTK
jgi:starvation-inducible DNA-binding protein